MGHHLALVFLVFKVVEQLIFPTISGFFAWFSLLFCLGLNPRFWTCFHLSVLLFIISAIPTCWEVVFILLGLFSCLYLLSFCVVLVDVVLVSVFVSHSCCVLSSLLWLSLLLFVVQLYLFCLLHSLLIVVASGSSGFIILIVLVIIFGFCSDLIIL